MSEDPFAQKIRAAAREIGFDALRFSRAEQAIDQSDRLNHWLASGAQGDMAWMAETRDRRAHPQALWPEVRSIIMVGVNYGPDGDPLATLALRDCANISVYGRNRDYHDILKGRLKQLAQKIVGFARTKNVPCDVKVFVDTAPVMEKPLAMQAGLGWQGKHSNLVSRDFGSWLFLGAIFTTLELAPDSAARDHCGACSACLDACPTQAFPAPYRLDARRCLSYLTIEHKGSIPHEFRAAMGNRIYGCDDCLAVCPWNKFAQSASEIKLRARKDLIAPDLTEMACMDEAQFRAFFSGSPIKRIGHSRFLRNVLIAIGNSDNPSLAQPALRLVDHPHALVRGAAIWALSRLLEKRVFRDMAENALRVEPDLTIRKEWLAGQSH